jgi:hypothetical protein
MSGFAAPAPLSLAGLSRTCCKAGVLSPITMKKHLFKPHIWSTPLLIVIDMGFFGLTDPNKVDSGLLIIGYLLLVVTLFAVMRLLARVISLYGVPKNQANRVMGMTGGVISLCLALSSVGELSMRDLVVILPLAALLYIYLFYAKAAKA